MTDNNAAADAVVIERTLDAPIDLVYAMWADPEHFKAWYGPMGATIPVAEMDVQVGGKRKVCMAMETPNGPMEMWFVGEFREIVANERLVYTEAMADADGNLIPPEAMGMSSDHPATTEITVVLSTVGEQTKMVMTHAGIPADSPGAQGWNMALDKLEALLAG